jgi:hypothetical protein
MSYFNVVGNHGVFYTIISHEEFSMIQNPSGILSYPMFTDKTL